MIITFIGDVHTFHMIPSSRRDDFPNIILEKILKVKKYSPSDVYIFLGDLTHKSNMPLKYLVQVIIALNELGPECYSIVGNHDVARTDVDKLDESALGLLFRAGVLKKLDYLVYTIGDRIYNIVGHDYGKPLPDANSLTGGIPSVLVTHSFYEQCIHPADEAVLTDEDLKSTGALHIVMGHDHAKYDIYTNKYGQYIYRPGSLSRGTAHYYNLEREISVLRMKISESGIQAKYVDIPTAPVQESFKRKVSEKKPVSVKDVIKVVKDFIAATKQGEVDIFPILDNVEIKDLRIRTYIEALLVNAGYLRSSKESIS